MKVVQINSVCGQGSTGKICVAISKLLSKSGVENYILYSEGESNYNLAKKYISDFYRRIQAFFSRLFGNYGFNCILGTKKLVKILKRINPDIVHLHNVHGHGVNLRILFSYLKKNNKKVFWTFHDCWAFTGYCTYFTMAKCDKWKTVCNKCPQRKTASWFFDKSNKNYLRKRNAFKDLDLTIVTPSKWLADLVKQSFLKEYTVKVINNGIDLSVFKPTESDFREKCNIFDDKYVLLGVAFGWGKRKGLDVFIELSKRLPDNYQIVLVGTDDIIDKQLPSNIISIHRTQNQTELAGIYTAADLFVNPTREEVFGLVNDEALACGTPVITFRTGGSPECIDVTCGSVVDCDDIKALQSEIIKISKEKIYSGEACISHAKSFDMSCKYSEYISLYGLLKND